MKKTIIILGAGRMAKAMVYDLHKDFELTIADISDQSLDWFKQQYGINTLKVDVTDKTMLQAAIAPFDLVIGAVTGQFGFNMLKYVIEAGKPIVDISFSPEDMLQLDALAKANNTTAIVDIGVAPGLSNLVLGHETTQQDINTFKCMVGGLPVMREWPFEYKAPFSPIDVIEEYTRPARIKRNGEILTMPALEELETVQYDGLPKMESFISDGLRSILQTVDIPNMEEKTIRYPGHCALMKVFRETGLFDEAPKDVNGQMISPRTVTASQLLPKWKLNETDEEFTVMSLDFASNGQTTRYFLHDQNDRETGLSSMARTTGLTCASAARLYLEGLWQKPGVFPPEIIGMNGECFTFMMHSLKKHNIEFKITRNEKN